MVKNEFGFVAYSEFMESDGVKLYTVVIKPNKDGKFPVILMRCPYVDECENMPEDELLNRHLDGKRNFLEAGFAVVDQHCRGRGKSEGVFVPFVDERKDGLALQAWVREQEFYNGEIYLYGGSYTSAVHLATAPFADDIKGAVLEVMTTELYCAAFRNEIYKVGLFGIWFEGNYKNKQIRNKNINIDNFLTLPFENYPEKVFHEKSESVMDIIRNYKENSTFWSYSSPHGAYSGLLNNNRAKILFTTGWYDIFVGGMLKMYENMDNEAKNSVALTICPYDHSMHVNSHPMPLKNGMLREYLGTDYVLAWLNAVKDNKKLPLETGKITYYETFNEKWTVGDLNESGNILKLRFKEEDKRYVYDPKNPVRDFKGGLSHNFGSTAYQEALPERNDVITVYSEEFNEDILIKGKIKLKLAVKSNCEDTAFYIRLYVKKKEGDYAFRDDIMPISYQNENYIPGETEYLNFSLEPISILIKKGEKIRMDISSSAFPLFLPHTNQKGDYYKIKEAKIAVNEVVFSETELILPISKK